MPVFGDAAKRSLAPGNVSINNSDLSLNKLCESSMNNTDITFVYMKNLNTAITNENNEEIFNKDNYIKDDETNFVLTMANDFAISDSASYDSSKVNLFLSTGYTSYTVSNPNIYSDSILNSKYYFNIPTNTSTIKYRSLFTNTTKTPILIEEHIDNTIVVYIAEDLINNATSNYKVIYELMTYIYFNSYSTSDTVTDWISDVMPDYIVKDNKLIKKSKFTSNSSISDLVGLRTDEILSIKVIIDSTLYPYVNYDGITNNCLTFSKIKGSNNEYSDPKVKPAGWISLYTNEQIFFYENFIYKINDSISDCVNVQQIDDDVVVEVKPFRYSDLGIYIKYNQSPIKIPLTEVINNIEQKIKNETYYLICKENDSASFYELLKDSEYTSDLGKILLTINIAQDTTQTQNIIYDMRRRGGGLPKNANDNFDCFDIG
jgi:hypothetical protein